MQMRMVLQAHMFGHLVPSWWKCLGRIGVVILLKKVCHQGALRFLKGEHHFQPYSCILPGAKCELSLFCCQTFVLLAWTLHMPNSMLYFIGCISHGVCHSNKKINRTCSNIYMLVNNLHHSILVSNLHNNPPFLAYSFMSLDKYVRYDNYHGNQDKELPLSPQISSCLLQSADLTILVFLALVIQSLSQTLFGIDFFFASHHAHGVCCCMYLQLTPPHTHFLTCSTLKFLYLFLFQQ